jgi:hypothetical protein
MEENYGLPATAHRDVVDPVRAQRGKMRFPVGQRFEFRCGGATGECEQDGGHTCETNNFNHAKGSLSYRD